MSNLKPRLCSWLYAAWHEVSQIRDTIVKGWDKTGITRAFLPNFQLEAMEANTSSSLFTTDFNIEKIIPMSINVELDPALPLSSIIDDCLTSKATTGSSATTGNKMRQLARKVQSPKCN